MWLTQRLAKEPLRRCCVPFDREQEVNRLAAFIDRPVEVSSATLRLYISLVYPPRAITHSQMEPSPLLAFDGISLNPPKDRHVIHRHPAIRQQHLEVDIAHGENRR